MKNHKSFALCTVAVLVSAFTLAGVGRFRQETMPKPVSKVTPTAAMAAAEAKTGGKAIMAIFEFDEGHWIYGVLTVKNHKLTEVDVDPVTGKAGATEAATPDAEAKELKDALAKLAK